VMMAGVGMSLRSTNAFGMSSVLPAS